MHGTTETKQLPNRGQRVANSLVLLLLVAVGSTALLLAAVARELEAARAGTTQQQASTP